MQRIGFSPFWKFLLAWFQWQLHSSSPTCPAAKCPQTLTQKNFHKALCVWSGLVTSSNNMQEGKCCFWRVEMHMQVQKCGRHEASQETTGKSQRVFSGTFIQFKLALLTWGSKRLHCQSKCFWLAYRTSPFVTNAEVCFRIPEACLKNSWTPQSQLASSHFDWQRTLCFSTSRRLSGLQLLHFAPMNCSGSWGI